MPNFKKYGEIKTVKLHAGMSDDIVVDVNDDTLIASCLNYANNDIEETLADNGFCETDINNLKWCDNRLNEIAEKYALSNLYLISNSVNEDGRTAAQILRKTADDKLVKLMKLLTPCEDNGSDEVFISQAHHDPLHHEDYFRWHHGF